MATYWQEKGTYQTQAEELQALLPTFGEVDKGKTTNKALERFRRAQNCYYDLYNNGLCNRAREFSTVFRIVGVSRMIRERRHCGDMLNTYTEMAIDKKMDDIIMDAYREQVALGKLSPKVLNEIH
jgi:hypothetical protein